VAAPGILCCRLNCSRVPRESVYSAISETHFDDLLILSECVIHFGGALLTVKCDFYQEKVEVMGKKYHL
jgi:hypothetical protein